VAVRIGKGGINDGFITEEACNRALNTIQYFNAEIQERGIKRVFATATSAFRNAKNGEDLAASIKAKTGISIAIISGDREAELIYYGIKEALSIGKEKALIVDIGGGSAEFIIANDTELFWKQSFEIGGQRMIERFQKTDPIQKEAIANLTTYLNEALIPLRNALKTFPTKTLIGSSGSFDTFSEMVLRKKGYQYSIETKKEYEISLEEFSILYDDIVFNGREQRLALPGMIDLRVDMIVVATILVRHLVDSLNLKRIRVSTYALKEGALSSIIKGEF
jgi:exopolyphosphatase/guanosine-5'-triphosphate,3'-diphosphate pyrophosphatase